MFPFIENSGKTYTDCAGSMDYSDFLFFSPNSLSSPNARISDSLNANLPIFPWGANDEDFGFNS